MKLIFHPIAIVSLLMFFLSCSKSDDGPQNNPDTSWTLSTLAGSTEGYKDGSGTNAQFDGSTALCVDEQGNIYVADLYNHRVRKVTPSGLVTTLAGSAQGYLDGNGISAKFDQPTGICVDKQGNLFVADMGNHKIRKITPDGTVTTVAGSTVGYVNAKGTAAKFNYPVGICVVPDGSLYIADQLNGRIRKITPDGTVSFYAGGGLGNGPAASAGFTYPTGVCADGTGIVYVMDYWGFKVRKISNDMMVTTLAGSTEGFADSTGIKARFSDPFGLCLDKQNNVFVADMGNHKIRKVTPDGVVTTIIGIDDGYVDGNLDSAKLSYPSGICVDSQGNFYIAEVGGDRIRKLSKR